SEVQQSVLFDHRNPKQKNCVLEGLYGLPRGLERIGGAFSLKVDYVGPALHASKESRAKNIVLRSTLV
ncbi:MAG: hypothetical protein WBQ89_11910, partial [Candidatus Acidiferrum sp.]